MTALAVWALWGGVALGGAAGALLLRALFADRSRGRRRCPKCWYLMDGVVSEGGLRCPECGHAATSVHALQRTKRRWGWAALACLLGMIAYGVAVTPRVVEGGWRRAVPSTLLVSVWPMDVEAWVGMHLREQVVNDAMLDELDRRVKEEELTRWQERWWVGRVERWVKAHGRLGIEEERPVIEKLKAAEVNWTFNAEPLEAVMERLSREIGVPVRVDWDALVAEGVRPEGLVSGRLEGVDGREAVQRVVDACWTAKLHVWWWVEGATVRVGVFGASGNDAPIDGYDVGPLVLDARPWRTSSHEVLPQSERVDAVIWMMKWFVRPEDWVDGGGLASTCTAVGTHVLVRAPADAHYEVAEIMSAISLAAAHERTSASADEEKWAEFHRAHQRLSRSMISLRPGRTPLSTLLAEIGGAAGLPVRVDWSDLKNVRVWEDISLDTFRGSLSAAAALDRFVERLNFDEVEGVSWTISRGTLVVERESGVRSRGMVRVYNVGDLGNADAESGRAAVDEVLLVIMNSIDTEGWVDGGGDTSWALPVGHCLVIRTTPRNHLAIEHLLATLRAGPPKRAMSTPATEPEHEEE